MPSVDIGRLLNTQARLFDNAHKTPIELKSLGLAMKQQGLDGGTLYCNPGFMLLPLKDCRHLSRLTAEQLGALTAAYFACAYSEIASSETVALRYNMAVSERVFPVYSDDYMILFNETDEEYDHIITFRNVCQALIGQGDAIGIGRFAQLKPVYDTMAKYENTLCAEGFGGLYLLLRYLLNLALKQMEGFMAKNISEGRANALAMQIIDGHAQDEARHLTTSLELGLGLWEQARPASREVVTRILKTSIYSMIDKRFTPDLARVWHHEAGVAALRRALALPQFAGAGLDADQLRGEWQSQGIEIPSSPDYENSRRWMAAQIAHLANRLNLKLTPGGPAFERYQDYAHVPLRGAA